MRALLDTGSSRTFCSTNLIKALSLSGPETVMDVATVNGPQSIKATEVSLQVTGVQKNVAGHGLIVLENVLAVDVLPSLVSSGSARKNIVK